MGRLLLACAEGGLGGWGDEEDIVVYLNQVRHVVAIQINLLAPGIIFSILAHSVYIKCE